ncbi:MAG: SRPBCC family protein [Allosphingosinicella sp.]
MERVRVSRLFDVPAERVFDSWFDRDRAGSWLFATPDGEMVRVEIDARIGGRFEIVERRGEDEVLHTGSYEEIERPRRLVFTLQVPKFSPDVSRVAIDIEPTEPGCRLLLEAGEADPQERAKYEKGWSMILAGLAAELGPGETKEES